jgi:hypothetical protein
MDRSAFLNTEIGRVQNGDKIKVVVDAYKPKTIITVYLIIHQGDYYLNTQKFNNGVHHGVPTIGDKKALYKFSPGQRGIKFKEIVERGVSEPLKIEKISFKAPEPHSFSENYSNAGLTFNRPPEPAIGIIPRRRRIMKLNQNL